MQKDTVIAFKKPDINEDLLTEVLRQGARQLLATAIEAEVKEFLDQQNNPDTKSRFVRNGYLPEREIQTGIGTVAVEVPRVRDRESKIHFSSSVIPKYLRRSVSMNEFLPLMTLWMR